jgi:hypothetical protein
VRDAPKIAQAIQESTIFVWLVKAAAESLALPLVGE